MEGYIGEMRMFGGNFAPRSWAFCNGQLLAISSNTALFSILGTTYGGDGRTSFALPDLRGRVAMHAGNGPGLTPRQIGQRSGSETNSLTAGQLPSHSHALRVADGAGTAFSANGNGIANTALNQETGQPNELLEIFGNGAYTGKRFKAGTIGNTGASQPINNIQPFNTVNFIICLQGIYPSRS